jgi:hypothetical protein
MVDLGEHGGGPSMQKLCPSLLGMISVTAHSAIIFLHVKCTLLALFLAITQKKLTFL